MDQRGRAAATIAQPLEAEVFVDGIWRPGAVLGWRHDGFGRCEASVRVHLAGGARVLGVDLAALRLPEAPGASPDVRQPPAATVVISRAALRKRLGEELPRRVVGRRRRHASDLTAELPAVRCADGADIPGRHRAGDQALAEPASSLLTRPIRLVDLVAWSWGSSSVAST